MNRHLLFLLGLALLLTPGAFAQTNAGGRIPGALRDWEDWATWNERALRESPTPYADRTRPLTFWPSQLRLVADAAGATFRQTVTVYSPCWVPLPGDEMLWPGGVTVGGKSVPVLRVDDRPAVWLPAGTQEIAGRIAWAAMPQNIPLPRETGIVTLTVDGVAVAQPLWDADGLLWLKRDASPEESAGPDSISPSLYGVLQDGVPLWLRVRVELVVSGKSREEDLGTLLPQGWKISAVESPLPIAVEKDGRAKAQVRAGKWFIDLTAFRLDDVRELTFGEGAAPPAESMLLGFRAEPDFRVVELTGVSPVDVEMTTFPEDWRNVPVYQWPTDGVLRIEERLRGMDEKAAQGLRIARSLWLDEGGRGMTFRDQVSGTMQKIWRLNAAEGQELGSVRSGGQGQLVTRDPADGAPGVEIRTRNISLEATGRMKTARTLSATGWRTDAENVEATLNLPPGWRLFALFGADWVDGDWLTSWSLLDIFVVLIFSLAVLRLWGFGAAVLALAALVLSYRETGAPQLLWLALLAPLAILRVTPPGRLRIAVNIWKWVTVAAFIFAVVPFVWTQLQQAIYPQLEPVRPVFSGAPRDMSNVTSMDAAAAPVPAAIRAYSSGWGKSAGGEAKNEEESARQRQNLLYEAKAKIQTGPGIPEWTWRTVRFGWNGPVTATQTFRPVLVPAALERLLTVLRTVAVIALLMVLLGVRRPRAGASVFAAACILLGAVPAQAQFPDDAMLATLRERVLDRSDLPAEAAQIENVALALNERRLVMQCDIHAAALCAVPLPGQLPAWSPVAVTVDGQPAAALRREDGYVWVALPAGVHKVRVEGLLGDAEEWEWTFQLKPRRVSVEAPGWNVTGIDADGAPEQQVFFSRQQKSGATEAAYDRQDFEAVAVVQRELELGLVWQARTTVRRLSQAGKAIAINVPLLPGERMLGADIPVKNGLAEVRLPAGEDSVTWTSELETTGSLVLATRAEDAWAEQWRLIASPVWNVSHTGVAPVFEQGAADLVPVWRPWPGEKTELTLSRPEPVPGATVTVRRVQHEVALGDRQRGTSLTAQLTSSLGEDFLVGLPEGAQITALTLDGRDLPARVDQGKLVVPLRPGEQTLAVAWKTSAALTVKARVDAVRFPVESANVETVVTLPDSRWVLWTGGPQRGPAVQFWVVLAFSLLAAVFLGRLRASPLKTREWLLLGIGLTQVTMPEALVVVAWFFLLVWRGRPAFPGLRPLAFNAVQILIVLLTFFAVGVLIRAVGAGLLGSPEMFIDGNGSTAGRLSWYLDRSGPELPRPWLLSVSVWWYRLAMLLWALWLAAASLRWLASAWTSFVSGGVLRPFHRNAAPPPAPPIP